MNNTPKLRFKEFSGDWKKKKLGKITKLTDGVHFTPTYVESGVPFWSVETVVSNANPKYITQEAHNDAIKRCNPQINDILLTRIGTLAKPKLINWNEEFSIYVSLALIKASNNYNSKFARYYFETEYYQKDFLSKSLLTATPKKINMEDLKQTNINLPSLEEQEKIASFFSLIDDKISLQGEKVEALKDYKKGIMQKIFTRNLRFKDDDGKDYPEWEEKKMDKLIYEPTKTKEKEPHKQELLTVKLHCLGIEATGKYPNSTQNGRPYYKRFKGELLIGRQNMHNGGMGIVDDECNGLIASNAISSYINNEGVSIEFIYYTISRIDYYKRIDLLIGGTGQKEISKKELENLIISTPCLEEQNKIVKFLNKVNIKLEKEQEKLDSLNEYKKGLLQQMFI